MEKQEVIERTEDLQKVTKDTKEYDIAFLVSFVNFC